MDNSTDKGDREKESPDELDLSDLQNFNFAANWSESTAAPSQRERSPGRPGGPGREKRPDRRPSGAKKPRSAEGERGDRRSPSRPDRRPRSAGPSRREEVPPQALLRESPFDIQIFPEEPILATLTQAMRQSLRTYELFEVARLILEKPERFHLNIRFREEAAAGKPLFQSVPDGLPFTSEEAAFDHAFRSHADKFFTVEEVEVEPPKGSFQFIARCSLTGVFLSPPNYHRFQSILLQYHQDHFPNMPFERFRSNIETVKDDEAIEKWLQSMTRQKRYRLTEQGEGEEVIFDTPEEARAYLLQNKKEKVVRSAKAVRVPGKALNDLVDPEIKPYVLAYVEHQRRFPLDTANTMRGRLRRQHFFIYKKGARGISFVCAVKRKFRQPGQVFSDSVQSLISFIEENNEIQASQLREKFLGIPPAPEGEQDAPVDAEAEAKLKRLNLDLRWLLSEGYVTEYSDGRLSVHPVLAEKRPEKESRKEKAPDSAEESKPAPEIEKQENAGTTPELVPEKSVGDSAKREEKPGGEERKTAEEKASEPETPPTAEPAEPAESAGSSGPAESKKPSDAESREKSDEEVSSTTRGDEK